MRGGIHLGDHCLRPRFIGFVEVWKDFRTGDGTLSTLGVGVSTPCGAVSTRGVTVFVPGFVGVVAVWTDF